MKATIIFVLGIFPVLSLAQGLIPETAESLKGVKRTVTTQVTLPDSVDLSHSMPTPGYQGQQGACVAWAVAYARAYYQMASLKPSERRQLKDEWNIPSPSYIYRYVVNTPNKCDSGSTISGALNFLRYHGAAAWAAFPYTPNNCRSLSSAEFDAGTGFRIFDFEYIGKDDSQDSRYLNDIKAELAEGNPVIVAMKTTDAFDQLKQGTIYNHPTRCTRSDNCNHAVVFVGYDKRKQAFKLLNSWGTKWAEGGFGWISYETAKTEVFWAFVIRMEQSKPRIVSFRVQGVEGNQVILEWEAHGADSLEIPGVGDIKKRFGSCSCPGGDCSKMVCGDLVIDVVNTSDDSYGTVRFKPSASTTFTLRAENPKGISTAIVDVTVVPPGKR